MNRLAETPQFFFHTARLKRILVTVLAGVALALIFTAFADWQNRTSSLLRGDFPAFYAAARLVREGRFAELYSPAAQQAIENEAWPSLHGSFLYFAYPPFFAIALAPLGVLPPLAAKFVFTALLTSVAFLALFFVPQVKERANEEPLLLCASLFLFPPIFSAIWAGQNTLLSLAIYGFVLMFIDRSTTRDDFRAGMLLGLWCFKPNFAAIFIMSLLFARRYVVLCGVALSLVLLWTATTLAFGIGWHHAWFTALRYFAPEDMAVNGHQMISLLGFTGGISTLFGISLKPVALFAMTILLTGVILYPFIVSTKRSGVMHALLVCAPAALLISPHTLYYDLGLIVIPMAILLRDLRDREIALLILLYAGTLFACLLKHLFIAQPLFGVLVFALIYTAGQRQRVEQTFN